MNTHFALITERIYVHTHCKIRYNTRIFRQT